MIKIEKVINENCSPNLLFIKENRFQDNSLVFRL